MTYKTAAKYIVAGLVAVCFAATVYSQGLLTFPNWTTPTRVGNSPGAVGFNTQTNLPEYLDNFHTWNSFGSGGGGSLIIGTSPITGGVFGDCLFNNSGTLDNQPCGQNAPVGADPTAIAGPTVIPGSATTFMRSDAAPAVQLATLSVPGLTQPDGTTITANGGIISAIGLLAAGTNTQIQINNGGQLGGETAAIATGCQTTGGTIGNVLTATIATSFPVSQTVTTTPYAIAASDQCNLLLLNTGASVLTLAAASTWGSGPYWSIDNASGNSVTLNITTSNLDGATTVSIPNGTTIAFQSDGVNYHYTQNSGATAAVASVAAADTSVTVTPTTGAVTAAVNQAATFSWTGPHTFSSVFGKVTSQSGTTYTFAATDCGTTVVFTNAGAVTATIPAALTTGCNIAALQAGAGQVAVNGTAVSAATLHSAHSYTKTFGQWAVIGIDIYTTGVAILTGDGA